MSRKIIGVTVGTPISPRKIEEKLKPVKTVNGVTPDKNGNVNIGGSSGISARVDGEILVFADSTTATVENETLIL